MGQIKHYYVSGHTQVGYFSVLPEKMERLEVMFVIKHLSRKRASEFLHMLAQSFIELGHQVDYYHSPSDNDKLEGIRSRDKNIAIFSYEVMKNIDADFSEQRIIFLTFQEGKRSEQFMLHEQTIKQLEKERDYHYDEAYKYFREAKHFHEQKEAIFISAIDFQKADEVAKNLIEAIFNNDKRSSSKQKKGSVETIFFGAATPKGAVNFIDSLTSEMKKRYIIKGRSGSGKSTLIRKVGNEAINRGYDITYFLCGFDPSSIDMIIIDDLKVTIIDGTSPHVIDATRDTDEIVDLFLLTMDQNVDHDKKEEIDYCESNYKLRMKKGTLHLMKAKQAQDVIDEYIDESYSEEKLTQLLEKAKTRIIESIS